ncbi:DUF222 domain-containing protein [Mumia sp. DW29H23]|uniref:HNH endonuclease signature motif containing protein n=1 Tax=Mumia sp. DW29H23 TaxID=3421241 RepID=UPI003D694BF3
MFEAVLVDALGDAVVALAGTSLELATNAEKASLIRAVQTAQDLLDGVKAEAMSSFAASGGPEDDGAPTVKAWARRELNLSSAEAGRLVTAGRTMRTLPPLREALNAGRVRLDHVHEFSTGLKKGGEEIITLGTDYLVSVAESHEPPALREEIRSWIDAIHPDSLDEAYIRGMDKRDLQVSRVGDGFVVDGFLDVTTGAKLKTVLDSLGRATGRDDRRAPSERRVAGLEALLDTVLDHGLPTRKGIRPQLQVTVDLDRLQGRPGAEPARLEGWGVIGDRLLGSMLCDSDVTGILTAGFTTGALPQAAVLNVGRSERLATLPQRKAILARQEGRCANPGCSNVSLEIHHLDWWARDLGSTDLDTLVGLCARCHHLVHAGRLHARSAGDGTTLFTLAGGTPLPDERRTARHLARQRLRILRDLLAGPANGARPAARAPAPAPATAPAPAAATQSAAGVDVDWDDEALVDWSVLLELERQQLQVV